MIRTPMISRGLLSLLCGSVALASCGGDDGGDENLCEPGDQEFLYGLDQLDAEIMRPSSGPGETEGA